MNILVQNIEAIDAGKLRNADEGEKMHRYNKLHGWIIILIALILLTPLLHLYISQVTLHKIKETVDSVDLLMDDYKLSRDISTLINDAQDYLLYKDGLYMDRYNESSTVVIKEEQDLYQKLADDAEKEDFKRLMTLTEEYMYRVQTRVKPALESDQKAYLPSERYKSLVNELRKTSDSILTSRYNSVKQQTSGIIVTENSMGIALDVLLGLSLLLLILGALFVVYPGLTDFSHLAQLTGQVKEAYLLVDRRGTVTGVNPAAEKLLNVSTGMIVNRQLDEVTVLYPPVKGIIQPLFNVILEQKTILNNQVVFNDGGEKIFLNIDYYPLKYMNRLTGAMMLASPVEMQKNKRYLFDTIEAERKKISIEIHDWIGRGMSPIIHQLDYIMRAYEGNMPEGVYDDLGRLRTHCQAAAMDMRSIMNDIHPYLIDKVGLLSALQSYIASYEQMHGKNVYLFYQSSTLNINRASEIIIYRIIQEALSNVVKHSCASEVDIYFREEKDVLKIEILDNGDPPGDVVAGKGLWGMKERAHLIGGDIVYSSGESGFSLTLTVPLAMEVENEKN